MSTSTVYCLLRRQYLLYPVYYSTVHTINVESASCLEQSLSDLDEGHNCTGGAPEEAQSRNPITFSLQLSSAFYFAIPPIFFLLVAEQFLIRNVFMTIY